MKGVDRLKTSLTVHTVCLFIRDLNVNHVHDKHQRIGSLLYLQRHKGRVFQGTTVSQYFSTINLRPVGELIVLEVPISNFA